MKVYLGDGAYAEDSGDEVRIYTQRESGIHEVFLGDRELEALLELIERTRGLKFNVQKTEGLSK